MMLGQIFERFIQKSPLSVMARAMIEHALKAEDIDRVFEDHRVNQYTKELLFSCLVDLMSLVVFRIQPSVHAAYPDLAQQLAVSLAAVYDKLRGVEPAVCRHLVRHTSDRLDAVIAQLDGATPTVLDGYRVKILDGNHLGGTQHRIEPLRRTHAAALPGQTLVVLDPQTLLVTDVVPWEDAYTQERIILEQILPAVGPDEVWIEDRNFCTTRFVFGVLDRRGSVVVRQHRSTLTWEDESAWVQRGRVATGMVWEQTVGLTEVVEGRVLRTVEFRRVRLDLDQPTEDGETEIFLITNLPAERVSAQEVAEVYRNRWRIEHVFQALTEILRCEVNTLAYPKAALFGFCTALASYNVLATIRAALRAVHGAEKVEEEVSTYHLANEIRVTYQGMMIAIEPAQWSACGQMDAASLAGLLRDLAARVHLRKYRRRPRGPKKPKLPWDGGKRQKHVSTARILNEVETTDVTP